ncbi:MAG TPA: hypothetical protein VIM41_08535 [Gammaproteobacteria bacterium]
MFYTATKRNLFNIVTSAALAISVIHGGSALADDNDEDKVKLTPQDALVTTIINKSVISGAIRKNAEGNMVPDANGMLSFDYTGDVYSVKTDKKTGVLEKLDRKIGSITGTAAFPVDFAYLSAGFKAIMDLLMTGLSFEQALAAAGFTGMPPVIPWTCSHCEMVIGDNVYVSIVDALDPVNGSPEMIAKFDAMLIGGAAGALDSMRLDGRAFSGLTPASFDPVNKTMSIRMAGCSAVVGVAGTDAGKVGTLCLNSTATFDVSAMDTTGDVMTNGSGISAQGTSNCTTVLHQPTL